MSLLRIGSMVDDRYGVVRLLGKGRFSQTYLVVDRSTHKCQNLALKVYYAEYAPIAARECEILAVLKDADPAGHTRNILFGGVAQDCLGLLLPVLSPYPLSLPQGEPLSRTQRLRTITFQLCTALMLLGDNGVIHADLKPDNVLCDLADPRGDVSSMGVRLCDFGNAVWDTESDLAEYFQDFEIQSLSYRAPEVVYGLPFNKAIDMWSLGCLLVELYRGHVLFRSRTRTDLAIEMAGLLSPPPPSYRAGKYYRSYASKSNLFDTAHNDGTLQGKLRDLMPTADNDFLDLLRGLLQYDAEQRLMPRDCLMHEFLQPVCPLALIGIPSPPFGNGSSGGHGRDDYSENRSDVKVDNSEHRQPYIPEGGERRIAGRGWDNGTATPENCRSLHREEDVKYRYRPTGQSTQSTRDEQRLPQVHTAASTDGISVQKNSPEASLANAFTSQTQAHSQSNTPKHRTLGAQGTDGKKNAELYFFPSVSPKKGKATQAQTSRQHTQAVTQTVQPSNTKTLNNEPQWSLQNRPYKQHNTRTAREIYTIQNTSLNILHNKPQNTTLNTSHNMSLDKSHNTSLNTSHNMSHDTTLDTYQKIAHRSSHHTSPVQQNAASSRSEKRPSSGGRLSQAFTSDHGQEKTGETATESLQAKTHIERKGAGIQTSAASTSHSYSTQSGYRGKGGRATRSATVALEGEGSQTVAPKRSRLGTKNGKTS
ncbi:CMGC/DYRK protein kinase [Sphaeroforma arctica JP610]|uniref:CMGC/DYRK protein kinase n=1 Tax=Sphaeroforma arctica JP610 TaxID=667725 RepID=A0A0L0GFV2_9EUKA|nr:CMGC/DYRK protein kinase [Sphaeroforma arctica JP610]KNC87711.1 CMGC/DYRK protein kinase [Sphaeroforma arctica JP610]|eukprot:XP_014161613.1 CMGC/DYRK protein kinase [Sphaeroforma arctica JP610]